MNLLIQVSCCDPLRLLLSWVLLSLWAHIWFKLVFQSCKKKNNPWWTSLQGYYIEKCQLSRYLFTCRLIIFTGSAAHLICYFSNWAQYRQDKGRFLPSNIDANLCTHLVYAFAGLNGNKITTVEWNDETLYQDFNGLKARYGEDWRLSRGGTGQFLESGISQPVWTLFLR